MCPSSRDGWRRCVGPSSVSCLQTETVSCVCRGGQSETWNWWYFLSWQRLGTWHWAQLPEERNILLPAVAMPLPNDPNQIFWPQREMCLLSQNKDCTLGSLGLRKSRKASRNSSQIFPILPSSGAGDGNGEASKLYRQVLQAFSGKNVVIDIGRYFYCTTAVELISRNAV